MIPMLPLCDSRAMLMPVNSGVMGCPPSMVPVMPLANTPFLCPPNNLNMFSTTSMLSDFDSYMYGRFRHVERESPRYRHAPFDWYKPPKRPYNIVHEDAAVVTLDGPVPIGDFYRYYIYGDDYDDYDDDYYDDDSSSFTSEEYDDVLEPSYEQRTLGYRRYPRGTDYDDEDINARLPPTRRNQYSSLSSNRRTAPPITPVRPAIRGTRQLAGDDDFDDARSVNSTFD